MTGFLIIALICAFVSGFFTLAALSYRTGIHTDEYRVLTSKHVEIFAGRNASTTDWARIFSYTAITSGLAAISFAAGVIHAWG